MNTNPLPGPSKRGILRALAPKGVFVGGGGNASLVRHIKTNWQLRSGTLVLKLHSRLGQAEGAACANTFQD